MQLPPPCRPEGVVAVAYVTRPKAPCGVDALSSGKGRRIRAQARSPGDSRRHPRSLPQPGLRHHLPAPVGRPLRSLESTAVGRSTITVSGVSSPPAPRFDVVDVEDGRAGIRALGGVRFRPALSLAFMPLAALRRTSQCPF